MSRLTQKVYKIKKVKGPGNYLHDYYSIHVTGMSVCNNEIFFEDNKRLATRLFYVDAIAKRILKNFFGIETRLRSDMVDNFGSYIGENLLREASLKGLISSSVCDIYIREVLDGLSYVCE